jgi:hypothetical protein
MLHDIKDTPPQGGDNQYNELLKGKIMMTEEMMKQCRT